MIDDKDIIDGDFREVPDAGEKNTDEGDEAEKGENEKGEPIYEEKYTYFSSSEVYKMCLNFAKNLHEKKSELIHKDSYNLCRI